MNESERSSSPNESRFEEWLAKSLHRVHCPDSLELGEYAVGLLNAESATKLETHLEFCPKCRAEVNFLRNFMVEESVSQAKNQPAESWIDKGSATIRRLVATLQPSFASSGMTGALRGTVGDQLVYEVEDVQVVIDIHQDLHDHGKRSIYGLVLGFEAQDVVTVNLQNSAGDLAMTTVDDLGNFRFEGLAKGEYTLRLQSNLVEIEVNFLQIE